MNRGPRIAALAVTIAALACAPDPMTAPPHPRRGPVSLQSSATQQATPLSISILPNEVVGGSGTATARVNVDSAVGCCDRTMQVTSNDPAVLPFLSSATTVSAGATFAAVQLLPATVSQPTVVTIFVTGNGVTVSVDLLVDPPGTPPPAPTLSAYIVNPSTVSAGTTSTGIVTLPGPAPAGGVVVALASRLPGSASTPPSVTVPPGATSVSFPIATFQGFPNSTTSVLLTASNQNTVVSTGIDVVTGTVAPTLTIASLVVSPTSVVGGSSSQGTVTLSGTVPSQGAVVTLKSGNPGVAATPSTVFIAGGRTSAVFPIMTTAVASSTGVSIFATFGDTRTATLTVNPGGTGTVSLAAPSLVSPSADQRFAPGTTVRFDWSDVSGAASYTIQVDDRDTFPSPLIMSQTVTASQLSTAALPTTTMWWRVRANSASGVAGPWSAVRRFELKN